MIRVEDTQQAVSLHMKSIHIIFNVNIFGGITKTQITIAFIELDQVLFNALQVINSQVTNRTQRPKGRRQVHGLELNGPRHESLDPRLKELGLLGGLCFRHASIIRVFPNLDSSRS